MFSNGQSLRFLEIENQPWEFLKYFHLSGIITRNCKGVHSRDQECFAKGEPPRMRVQMGRKYFGTNKENTLFVILIISDGRF